MVYMVFTWSKSHGNCGEKRFLKFTYEIGLSNLFEHSYINVASTLKLDKLILIEKGKTNW